MSDELLYDRIAGILEQARGQVARTVNTAMVQAYWLIGREIVEVEQAGDQRADHGDAVIQRLSARLAGTFGKGFSTRNLWYMRQCYLAFPKGSALPEIRQAVPAELDAAVRQAPSGESHEVHPATEPGPAIRQALPAGSGEGGILSALPSEFVGPRFPPALGWTHYLILMCPDGSSLPLIRSALLRESERGATRYVYEVGAGKGRSATGRQRCGNP